MDYAPCSDARHHPSFSITSPFCSLSFAWIAMAFQPPFGSPRSGDRSVCCCHHSIHAHNHCGTSGNPCAGQYRGRCAIHACSQPTDDPADVFCSIPDWLLGASPRCKPGQSCGRRALLGRAQPNVVLDPSCVRSDCAGYSDACDHHCGDRLFLIGICLAAVVASALAAAAFSKSVNIVELRWQFDGQARRSNFTAILAFGEFQPTPAVPGAP